MTTVLTYGTFDLFHIGHLRLLERLVDMGDRVIVGVSTDEFNATKGKRSIVRFDDRADIVKAIKGVDVVIAETSWEQKLFDIKQHDVDTLVMGDDWTGKFDDLRAYCQVVYLPRTPGVSSSEIRQMLWALSPEHLEELRAGVATLSRVLAHYQDLT